MFCTKCCLKPLFARAKPPVACKVPCGKLMKWYHKFCASCSRKLKKCQLCGATV